MNGLLDYFKTLNQPNQQGLTFVDRASMNPLLQAGIGILANNTGNYGQFGPALAKGLGYGLQNVMGYQQNKEDASIKKAQQDILQYDYETRRKKVEQEGMEDSAAQNAATGMFTALGFDPNNIAGEIGGFRPVSAGQQPIKSSPLPGGYNLDISDFIPNVGGSQMMTSDIPINTTPPQYKENKVDALLNKWGWGQEEKDYFAAMAKTDPKGAEKYLRNEMFTRAKAAMSSKRPDQRVGLEDALILISEGMKVPGYEQYTPEIANKYLGRKNEGRKAGAAQNSLSVGDIFADSGGKKAAETEGSKIGPQMADIENKYRAIDAIQSARRQLSKGIYAGYWGPTGLKVSKATMGALGDRDKAARTEKYVSYIGNVVIPRLSEFGGNDSVEELRYLKGVMAGDIEMEPEALDSILTSAEESIQLGIERLQRQRDAYQKGNLPPLDQGPTRAARQPAAPQAFSFTAPNGKTYTFPSKEKMEQFKKAAGVK